MARRFKTKRLSFEFLEDRVFLNAGSNQITVLGLSTNDIVYDSVSQRIFASVPSGSTTSPDSIAIIDPFRGTIEATTSVGSNPNKLAVSDDGQYLYVGLDGTATVGRLDLATRRLDLEFSLGADSCRGRLLAGEIEVAPDDPAVVAISVVRSGGCYPRFQGVYSFDNGVPRSRTTAAHDDANGIEFSSATTLYGATSDLGLYEMRLDDSGLTTIRTHIGAATTDFEFASGLVYSSNGWVTDPVAGTVLGSFDAALNYGPVLPDPELRRVYFLNSYRIDAFDEATFRRIGTLELSGVGGRVSSFIRWGDDGFAFRTDSGKVFLIRSHLAREKEPAIAVGAPALDFQGQPIDEPSPQNVLEVSNTGQSPVTISAVELRGHHVGDFFIGSTTCATTTLAVGAKCQIGVGFNPRGVGLRVAKLSIASDSPESPYYVDLSGIGTGSSLVPGEVRAITLTQNADVYDDYYAQFAPRIGGIEYDPVTRRMFASLAANAGDIGNTITTLDPLLGTIESSSFVGSSPWKLALSDNGQYLYVILAGSGAIRRLDLLDSTPGIEFRAGRHPYDLPNDIAVLPGQPGSVATVNGDVRIYDDGIPRSESSLFEITDIEFSDSAAVLFGYACESTDFTLQEFAVDGNGVRVTDIVRGLISGFSCNDMLEFAGGLIYSARGQVIDPDTLSNVGNFPVSGFVEPDPANGRTYFLIRGSPNWVLMAFDTDFRLVGRIDIPGIDEPVTLIRWEEDQLAFPTRDGRVILVDTKRIQEAPHVRDVQWIENRRKVVAIDVSFSHEMRTEQVEDIRNYSLSFVRRRHADQRASHRSPMLLESARYDPGAWRVILGLKKPIPQTRHLQLLIAGDELPTLDGALLDGDGNQVTGGSFVDAFGGRSRNQNKALQVSAVLAQSSDERTSERRRDAATFANELSDGIAARSQMDYSRVSRSTCSPTCFQGDRRYPIRTTPSEPFERHPCLTAAIDAALSLHEAWCLTSANEAK